MEQLLFAQEDLSSRLSKARTNYKKTSKERKTEQSCKLRLESLEELWKTFVNNHAELYKTAKPEVLKATAYVEKELFDTAEELYIDYKCLIMQDLYVESAAIGKSVGSNPIHKSGGNTENLAKLPKIVIPKFTGNYSEWITFRDLFKSLVHNTNIDNAVKMQYLKGSLGGEAEQLVRNFTISSANYDKCWNTLIERYNNKRFLCNTILKRLFSQRSSNSESASFLKEILDNTMECIGALSNLGVDVSTWDLIIIYMTSLKLDPESRKQWELESANITGNELPNLNAFQVFLTKRFRALEFVDTGSSSNRSRVAPKSFHVAEEANVRETCKFCKDQHKLVHCKSFEREEVPARRVFVEKQRLCFNCLGDGHSANQCRCRVSCRVCRRRHHTFLHLAGGYSQSKPIASSGSPVASSSGEGAPVVCFASGGVAPRNQVLLATALVKADTGNGDTQIVRVLLDQGSQASFITEATVQHLGLTKIPVRGVISGVGGGLNVSSKSKVKLNISSMQEGFQNIKLSLDVYVLKSITTLLPSKQVIAAEWVCSLPLADPGYNTPSRIDLLLGAEVVGQVMREGIQKQGSLLAQHTSLGWILSGVVDSNSNKQATKLISMHQVCVEEDNQLKKFWELEADTKTNIKPTLTEEETRCEKFFAETTRRDEDGRYIVKLPFKSEDLKVEKSKKIAEKRLAYLEAKLNKETDLKTKYVEVLEEYLHLDHMERIPEHEVNNIKGTYLPHFAVVRNDKDTTKVRIVFDASCKGENGVSLNDMMMIGPTLQPELRNILIRWRQHRICLSSDIVKMYRQVKVAAEDVDFQRILWRKDQTATNSSALIAKSANQSGKTEEFRLLRVTFGTASAPYLAVKALQQVAIDEGANYPVAAARVNKDYYMDDLLTGGENVESAMKLYSEMVNLLKRGGFELQKWSSNSEELLERIKETGKRVDKEDGIRLKTDEAIKLLGLTWNRRSDAFQYTVTLPQLKEPVTKRIVISDISRLFDPLGWVAPTVIVAKIIIQKLWISGIEWDEEVPSKTLEEWLTYRNELPDLSSLRITRWLHTSQKNMHVELHGFSDASKLAYAAVVYIRVIDEKGDIYVNLITAKTKVAPIKQVSIPRLELCGAVLAARLLVEVAETMEIEKQNIHAWTDSTVVLAWLNSHPNRWQTFIANRVSEILTTLDSHQWSHIRSKQNPADCASRGLKPSELVNDALWFNGPEVLHKKEVIYDRMKDQETNIEEIKVHIVNTDKLWERFSNLGKLVRVVAYCRRFMTWKKRKQTKDQGFLTTQELKEALEVCIKQCQNEHFEEEIASLEKSGNGIATKLKGPFKSLNPFLDYKQILRVGGRLEMSSLSDDRKHPILIPKKSEFTNLLIADTHAKTFHGGPQLMLTYLRSRFWVFGAKELVKAYVRKCVKCTRYSATSSTQLMGQLPAARVTPTRPFKCSGVDYAGPINVRTSKGRGQHAYKGYICLFVCMSTKAVHIEVVSDLTTEGFLAAFKRFVSRRGHCSDIWSDNGTGFVGASRQLPKMFSAEQSAMQSEVAASLASNGTKWHFIPPLSPNFGGLWEAGVKSVKYHLKRVVGETTLTFEELSTVLGQIEACLNSRPLSRVDTASEGYEALTPGHFLVGEPLLTVPDYSFENSNMGSLRRWQLTQKITQDFWRRWSQEYLSSLIHRYQWSFQTPEPAIGDLVLVKEDGLPPSRWLLGRVITKHPGPDNITRVVSLRTKSNVMKRPTSRLCILPITA